jgi:hypothetical protein
MTLALSHGSGRKGRIYLRQAVAVVGLFACLGASGRWYEFKGLYVNMPRAEVEKLGFKCAMGQKQIYEVCQPPVDDKRFATIGGARVKEIGVVIDNGKVNLIRIETVGAYWDELKEAMTKNYGKPKKDSRVSVLWDRGEAEYISAVVSKGKVEVIFGYSEMDSDKHIKERAKKAAKVF